MGNSVNSGFGLTPKKLQDNIIRAAAYTDKKGQLRSPNTRTTPFGARNNTSHQRSPPIFQSNNRPIETAGNSYVDKEQFSTAYSQLETVQPSDISMNQGSISHVKDSGRK